MKKLLSLLAFLVFNLTFFSQQTWTFTNANSSGNQGPTQSQVNIAYSGTNLDNNVTVNTQGIQEWVVPASGTYRILAKGAEGGDGGSGTLSPGKGASIEGEVFLTQGTVLKVVVGQKPSGTSSGGGGGTYVIKPPYNTSASVLIVAGGGGGAPGNCCSNTTYLNGVDGVTSQTGTDAVGGGCPQGTGGSNGNGGNFATGSYSAGGGGGFFTDGGDGDGFGGSSFINNSLGGLGDSSAGDGGFGGGGGAGHVASWIGGSGGGGGGYSGGGAACGSSDWGSGGGGGSFNAGNNQNNIAGANSGHGSVVFTLLYSVSINETSSISCFGSSDGILEATPIGGDTPYTYLWSGPGSFSSSSQTISGLSAGTYSVTVTDSNNLTTNQSYTLTEPASLVALSIADSNVSCNGGNNGGATASATGGTMPYTYSWNNAATTASITGVAAGTYSVTITDQNGCFDSASLTIAEPASLVASSIADSNISCNGASDAGATASATGGTMPYTYSWNNAATTASITGVAAGTYSVTITDQNGCFDSASITLTEPVSLVASSIADSNVSCNGASDAGATASATGGTAPYNYMWSNAATTASITGVTAGTYSVTITDARGCFDSASITLIEPASLIASSVADSNVSCNGGSDGGATASATGGYTPYAYTWNNAATTASITGVTSGTYSVTITDARGCFDSASITLTEPASLIASSVADSNISCNGGSDAGATASATGGTAPYNYMWNNAATTASVTGVTAGTYSVTITDVNGCFDSASITLTEPASLIASSVADSNVSCNGGSDGGATASATGGYTPYAYTWNNAATTASITGVTSGTYSVTITDARGCFDSASITLIEPASLIASSVADSNVSCNGGSDAGATASATGGTAPYNYMWSNAATTASITGVTAGTYSVTITDANGCFDSASITLTEPASLIASSVADSNVSCNGGSDAGATASATGGTAPYNYMWNNAATTASITGVAAGTYSVTITDDNGCFDSTSVTITEPIALGLTVNVNDSVSCPGGSDGEITSVVTGGTAPYNYQWNNTATTSTVSGLSVGTYVLTVTDDNGCTIVDSVSLEVGDDVDPVVQTQNVTVYLDNSGSASISTTDIDNGSSDNCSIDNLSLDATGFTCADTGANTVTLTATDVSGNTSSATATVTVEDTTSPVVATQNVTVYLDNNGSASIATTDIDNGSSDNCSIDNLSLDVTSFTCADTGSNTVTLTATDVSGNTSSATATVTVEDTTSPVVQTQNVTVYLDNSGSASISTTDIDNGSSDNCSIDNLSLDVTSFSCADTGLNTVTLTATDVSGNTSSATATVTVEDTTSPVVQTQNITVYLDNSGSVSIATTDIDNGSSDNCSIDNLSLDVTSFTCADTGLNTVTLTATDVSGNMSSATATVTVEDTTSPVVATQNVTVYLDNSGSASISTTDIDNGSSDNCSIDNLSLDVTNFTCADTGANTVTLTATDVSGNTSSATATVTVEDTTSPVVQTQNITVYLDNSGSASIATTDIDNGSSDNCSIDNLSLDVTNFSCADTGANTVTLTATDVSGNMSSATATVTVEDTTSPVVATQNVTVYLDNSGSASIATTDIDNGSSDNCSIDNLSLDVTNFTCADTGSNTVTLTATDVSGNTSSATATVTVEDTTSPIVATQNVTVYLDNAGSASIATTDIDNGSSDNCSIDNLSLDVTNFTCADTGSNTVTLTATDVSGNTSSATATVTVEDTTSPVVATQNVTVYLDNAGSASIATTDIDNGSSDNCSIDILSLDVTNFTCADTGSNTVTLTATDVSGNTSSATATVTVEDTMSPVVATQNLTVYLDNSGSASIATTDIDNGSSDNCSIDNLSLDVTSFSCADTGLNTVILTATDVSGNMSSATATVTVEDTTSPVVATQNITVYLDNSGSASISTTDIDNGSSDNCSIDNLSLDVTSFSCADTGLNTVILTATDVSGNTSSATATVTVEDTTSPVVATQNVTVYLDNSGSVSISTTDIDNGSSDNCSIDTMSLDMTTFSCADTGSQNVVLTVVDESGNSSSNTATVTVLDTIAPVITCPADIEICEGEIQFTDATSTDNCASTVTNTGSIFTGDSLSAGGYQLTFEAADPSGNTATCATDVTVNPLPMVNLGADTAVGPQHIVSFSTGYPNATNIWSTGDTTENISVQVEMDTTIWVSVTDSNSCAATDTVEVTILTGSEERTFTAEVKLYPNPTRGNVNLQVSGMEENMLYSVLDQTGRELQRGRIMNGQNRIYMNDYANALYFIKLTNEQGEMIKVYRIVKH